MLCLGGILLLWQSALSGGVFYFCGRVLCLGGTLLAWQSTLSGGILLVWQSALSEGYFTSVAECSVKPVSVGTFPSLKESNIGT